MKKNIRGFRLKYRPGWPAWLFGVAIMLFGLALLIWPNTTTALILSVFGGLLIAVGAFHIIRYFVADHRSTMYNFDLGIGIALAFLGLLVFLLKGFLLSLVPVLIGVFLLISGFVKLQTALDFKRLAVNRWYFELAAACVSLVLGILIILNPFSTALVLTRIIGASILIEGIQDVLSLRAYKRVYTTYFTD